MAGVSWRERDDLYLLTELSYELIIDSEQEIPPTQYPRTIQALKALTDFYTTNGKTNKALNIALMTDQIEMPQPESDKETFDEI